MARPRDRYIPKDGAYEFMGLNSHVPSTRLEPRYCPTSRNIQVADGIIEKRGGYYDLGTQIVDIDGVLLGKPIMALVDYETVAGTNFLVAITTRNWFKYNTGTDSWDDITKQKTGHTITVVNRGTKTFSVAGNQTADYPVGSVMNVSGSTGNDGLYTVVSRTFGSDTDIVVTQAIPHATANGTATSDDEWTGDETDVVDFVVGTDTTLGRIVMATNGKDEIRRWAGSGVSAKLAVNLASFVTASTLNILKNHLILGNVETTSVAEQTIAWSDTGDFEEFNTGNSGLQILADAQGAIIKLIRFGDRMAVFSQNSIGVITYVGGIALFFIEQLIQNTAVLGQRSITNVGPFVLYMTNEDVFIFDGSRLARPIGKPLKKRLRDSLNYEFRHLGFAFHDIIQRRIQWIVPMEDGTAHTSLNPEQEVFQLEYDVYKLDEIKWSPQVFADRITSMNYFNADGTLQWDDTSLVGIPFNSLSDPWGTRSLRKDTPIPVIGTYLGEVFKFDGLIFQEDGVDYDGVWETPDLTVPQLFRSIEGRWLEFEFEGRGITVDVSFSTDLGATFTDIETVTLDAGIFQKHKVFLDTVAEHCRFRFKNTTGWFQIRWLRAWMKAGNVSDD